jgi:hypothetical protein
MDGVTTEPHPQETNRTTRTFRDQHGRPWGGIIEQKTGHWVQPLAPKFDAPYTVPSKYVLPAPGDGSEVILDYPQLLRDLQVAWQKFEERQLAIAQSEYRDDPIKALKNPTKWLLDAIGMSPTQVNVVRACAAGNKWILGFTEKKPEWAYEFFPVVSESAVEDAILEFPDVEEEPEMVVTEYPHHVSGGKWLLSNGTHTKGGVSRDEALDIEKAIAEFAVAD